MFSVIGMRSRENNIPGLIDLEEGLCDLGNILIKMAPRRFKS